MGLQNDTRHLNAVSLTDVRHPPGDPRVTGTGPGNPRVDVHGAGEVESGRSTKSGVVTPEILGVAPPGSW